MKLFKKRTQDEAYNSLLAFFPPGQALEFVSDTNDPMGGVINALGKEIISVLNSMNDLSEDYDILVTSQLLSKWESALGIPDGCFSGSGSESERRLHVLLKFAKMNVQTAEQMRQLAVALGFVDTTVVPLSGNSLPPYDVPFIPSYAPDNRYIIQVTASGAVTNFPPYDVPFIPSSVNESLLSCIFNIIKPANCKVIFSNALPSPFVPASIASNNGWYDGSDFNSMVLDAGGEVEVWTNKSSGGSNLTASGSLRPRFVGTVTNGRGIVRFNGANMLEATSGDLLNLPTGDFTIMYVAKKNDANPLEYLINWQESNTISVYIGYENDEILTGSSLTNSDTTDDQFEVVTIVREGVNQSIQVDANTPTTDTNGSVAVAADTVQVGAFNSTAFFNGDVGEIAIFTEAISIEDELLMRGYFLDKWNI